MDRYIVFFNAQERNGLAIDILKHRIAQLFRLNDEKLDPLFIGQPVIVKKDLDEVTAEKYRAAIIKCGGVAWVEVESPFFARAGYIDRRLAQRRVHQRSRRNAERLSSIRPDRRQKGRRYWDAPPTPS